jgi:hypothetical protein
MPLGWRTIRVGNWRSAWSRVRSSASRRVFQAFFFILSPNLLRAGRARSPSSKLVCTCLAGRSATAPSMTTSSAIMRGSCENASWNTLPPRGIDHTVRIEIPLGGYVPSFTAPGMEPGQPRKPVLVERTVSSAIDSPSPSLAKTRRSWPRMLAGTCLLISYSTALIWLTCFVMARTGTPRHAPEPASSLWAAMLQGPGNTYIVPPDAGLNLVEDLSHQSIALADYLRGGYLDLPLPGVDPQSVTDLRTQQLTGFVNLQMIATVARLSEYSPAHVLLRFPRDLRFDDLKSANAVIIGSECSNPWVVIAGSTANFQIHCNSGMQGATIVNLKPQPGEAVSYTSHWNEPTHETYAVISYVPNLSGYGKLLLLGGLDAAATQAVGEALLRPETITPILQRARRPDGSLAAFEILLRSTSIQANATDTHIIASRIH